MKKLLAIMLAALLLLSLFGGAVNRIIEVEIEEKIYSDLVGLCAVISENYGFAGREFVEILQKDGALETINELQKSYYKELIKSDSTEKQAASASAILAADYIATKFIFEDNNNLTVEDMAKIMTKKYEVNSNYRAFEYITDLVARNPNRFKTNDYGDYQGEVWGRIEDKYIYIIKSVFDREMALAGFNSTAFLSWAKRLDLLLHDKEKRTKKARISSQVANCVCISKTLPIQFTEIKPDDPLPF